MTTGADNDGLVGATEGQASHINIEKVLSKHRENLMQYPNVNGVGIQEDSPSSLKHIQIYVDKKLPLEELDPRDILPKELDGFNVRVKEIGNIALE